MYLSNTESSVMNTQSIFPVILQTLSYMFTSFHRTDKRKTRLTGALCGLGWDDVNQGPMLPEHDIELTFDTKITTEDIKHVGEAPGGDGEDEIVLYDPIILHSILPLSINWSLC